MDSCAFVPDPSLEELILTDNEARARVAELIAACL
jgi:hypothetical protein